MTEELPTMRKMLPAIGLLLLIGCGVNPGQTDEPVDISGRVTHKGDLVNDVTLNLQPTGKGTPAFFPLKNGEFQGKATPGRYTWYISEGAKPGAFKSVPEPYRAGSLDRQIETDEGIKLDLTLE